MIFHVWFQPDSRSTFGYMLSNKFPSSMTKQSTGFVAIGSSTRGPATRIFTTELPPFAIRQWICLKCHLGYPAVWDKRTWMILNARIMRVIQDELVNRCKQLVPAGGSSYLCGGWPHWPTTDGCWQATTKFGHLGETIRRHDMTSFHTVSRHFRWYDISSCQMIWYDLMRLIWYDMMWDDIIWYDTAWHKHDLIWCQTMFAHICLPGWTSTGSLLSKTFLEACERLRCRSCETAYGTIAGCLMCHLRTLLGTECRTILAWKDMSNLFTTCCHCRLTRQDVMQNGFVLSEGTAKEPSWHQRLTSQCITVLHYLVDRQDMMGCALSLDYLSFLPSQGGHAFGRWWSV